MRLILLFCTVFLFVRCGGSLSDEQRKAFKKEMEARQIKKVSEDEIFAKAFEMGRAYASHLNTGNADSIAKSNGVAITFADSLSSGLNEAQKSLLEAYKYTPNVSDLNDNVQSAGDTIIYSAPVVQNGALQGIWFIDIPKKKIVLAL